jgi:hypothetical protein
MQNSRTTWNQWNWVPTLHKGREMTQEKRENHKSAMEKISPAKEQSTSYEETEVNSRPEENSRVLLGNSKRLVMNQQTRTQPKRPVRSRKVEGST